MNIIRNIVYIYLIISSTIGGIMYSQRYVDDEIKRGVTNTSVIPIAAVVGYFTGAILGPFIVPLYPIWQPAMMRAEENLLMIRDEKNLVMIRDDDQCYMSIIKCKV